MLLQHNNLILLQQRSAKNVRAKLDVTKTVLQKWGWNNAAEDSVTKDIAETLL
jgi:hypothetical protein